VNRSLPFALAVVVVAGLTGCGEDRADTATSAVATVDGTEISNRELVDELEAIEANADYLALLEGQTPVLAGEGEFDTAFVADTLRLRILYTIVANEVAAREISPSEACRDEGRQALVDQYTQQSGGDGEALLDGFDDAYRQYLVDREADLVALGADLAGTECGAEPTDEAIEEYLAANPDLAAERAGLLEAGGDFAALAQERSIDTGSGASGGDLGCNPPGQFVEPFAEAITTLPIGELSEPVQTEFGFHLIEVTERQAPSEDELRAQAEAALAQEAGQAFQTWFQEALPAAEVDLDERFGTWDSTSGRITEPSVEITDTGDG
jgi:hypothetical protein